MAREDFQRRRLRGIYERNKRRVTALADARDSRRQFDDEERAPRRFVVSERRTRQEGFGRGGLQVRRVERRAFRDRRPERFSDRGIFRRSNRDRFARDDDFERRERRLRFLDRRGPVGGAPRRFGFSRQRRALIRQREDRRDDRRGGGGRRDSGFRRDDRNRGGFRDDRNRGGFNNRNSDRRGSNGGNNRRNSRPSRPNYSKEQLDSQLDNYRRD